MKELRIAIAGTGGMAHAHANNFQKIAGCRVVAACDLDHERAKAFAGKFNIPGAYPDLEEMLDKSDAEAVSIVASDAAHAPLALQAIASGRHVLCEKPLATRYADAKKMADAARRAGVINMVNFSYRNSAAIHKAAELVKNGDIGRVIHFEASYLQSWIPSKCWGDWRTSPAWLWRLSKAHGSNGVLGDIGVHILDFTGYPLGGFAALDCRLKVFPKAKGNRVGKYLLDANDSAVIIAEMENGALGVIHTSRWASGHQNTVFLRIFGERGAIRIDLDKSSNSLDICRGRDLDRAAWKTVELRQTPSIYERFVRSIRSGKNDNPDFRRGAEIQRALDACFESDKKGRRVKLGKTL